MKRKKWTEEEEQTLLRSYSSFSSSTSNSSNSNSKKLMMILPPVKRQRRFQPIADHVNSLHHLADPSSYPFLWSWRDIAIKIHNMRHQYLNVKQKILLVANNPNSSNVQDQGQDALDWDRALDLWPNFLLYREVFGDIHLDPTATAKTHQLSSTTDDDQIDSDDLDEEDEEEEEVKRDFNRKSKKKRKKGGRLRWRERLRREERREQEDMEWMERVVGMQMEHEKQAMQMHADACQAQLQILGILVRVVCQFLGPGSGGGDLGLPSQVVDNLQHQQQQQQRVVEEEGETTESLVGHENGKNDGHSGSGYL